MENVLPKEIILDIFSRLPAESVLRCRRVCKAWGSLLLHNINNNNFVALHLRHQLQQLGDHATKFHNHLDVIAGAAKLSFISLIEIEYGESNSRKDDEENNLDEENNVDEDLGVLLYHGEYDENNEEQSYKTLTMINHPPLVSSHNLVGSCNGLICLSSNHHDIFDPVYICNPMTREYSYLPLFTDLKGPRSSWDFKFYSRPKFGCMMSGFGYNRSRNEYKVVRIYYAYDDNCDDEDYGCIEVYTLGSGSGWRSKGETTYRVINEPGVFANGALHWLEMRGNIVAFDLADEKFRVLPSPSFVKDDCQLDMYAPFFNVNRVHECKLGVLGGCFCIFHRIAKTESIDIWSFKKNNNDSYCDDSEEVEEYESWTWTKEFSIIIPGEGLHLYMYNPFALMTNGEVLLWLGRSTLARYDRKTATLEELMNYVEQGMLYRTLTHMNTLVSLKSLGQDSKVIGSVEEGEYSECLRLSTAGW